MGHAITNDESIFEAKTMINPTLCAWGTEREKKKEIVPKMYKY